MSIHILRVRARETKGFSLVEVVLALGVISFALVAILGVFPIGLAANRTSISDTRAAQVVNAVVSTIDAQCVAFSTVSCFGLSLDLATLNTGPTGNPLKLYVSYPSPNQPSISDTDTNSIYTVELRFDNDPAIAPDPAPNGTHLGPGKLNQIKIRILGKSKAAGFIDFSYLARQKN